MPKSTDEKLAFGRLGRRVIEADFSGGDLSTEGGALLLRRMGARLGLRELVLDVDATHVPLHGAQERGFFHGYCDNHCHLRRPFVLRRLELWGVDYLLGLQKNTRLLQCTELAELALAEQYQARGTEQRCYRSFEYAANSWDRPRQVIARLEHGPQGADPRIIVTSLRDDGRHLYDRRHCGRGEAENRIKEAQLDLFGRRAGCQRFWANPLRLLLASSHPVRAVFASAAHGLAPQTSSSAVPGTLTNNRGQGGSPSEAAHGHASTLASPPWPRQTAANSLRRGSAKCFAKDPGQGGVTEKKCPREGPLPAKATQAGLVGTAWVCIAAA